MNKVVKSLLIIICVSFIGRSYAQNDKSEFMVQGNIESLKDTVLNLYIWDSKAFNGARSATVPVSGGKFEFKGSCDEPMMVRGWINDARVVKSSSTGGFYPVKSSNIWFIVYPGAKIKVNGFISDFAEAYPADGGENDILSLLTKQLFPVLNQSVNNLRKSKNDKSLTPEQILALGAATDNLNRKSIDILKEFLDKHVSSTAGLWFLNDMIVRSQIDLTEAEKYLDKVDPAYSGLSYYMTLKTKIEGSKKTSVGFMVPEVVSNDTPDGSHFDLKSLRGKYVIIDFWGTWCMPCLKGMPAMHEFRDKNNAKLQILGIAKDGNIEAWKREIVASNLNWYHILNGTGDKDFVAIFNVQGYPTKIVIDPAGKIIYRITSESEEFYKEVDKLINANTTNAPITPATPPAAATTSATAPAALTTNALAAIPQNRQLKISVINNKEKPVRSVRIEILNSKIKGSTDKDGICVLENFSETDSLFVNFPGSALAGIFPVSGLREIQFNTSKNELIAFNPSSESWITGKARKVIRKGEFDIDNEILNGARNLEDLLKRMPSLMVTGGTVSLRSTVQTREFSSTAPLIIVDNFVVRGGLSEANRILDIRTIESIKVEKDGTLWSKEAVNGVILIRLKK